MNNVENLLPATAFLNGLEPVARDLCRLVGLPSDGPIPKQRGNEDLPDFKNWQIVAHRMLIAWTKQFPAKTRQQILWEGVEIVGGVTGSKTRDDERKDVAG